MRWTLNIGRLFGVKILIHWTFFLLLIWIVLAEYFGGSSTETILLTIVYILAIFLCVVLHEMGHITMARQYGINTRKITLLPIGGVASLEKIPENPKQELMVAIAGPLVNVAIALVLLPFLGDLRQYVPQSAGEESATLLTPDNFWFSLFAINLILVVFNLIPAFPMDGGRMFRALLAMRIDRLKATAIASSIGQIIAVGFFFAGLMFNPLLLLIGVFVFFGARGEHYMVQQNELMRGHTVSEAMSTDFHVFEAEDKLSDIQEHLISYCDDLFVVRTAHDIAGIVTRKEILKALQQDEKDKRVGALLQTQYDSIQYSDKLSEVLTKIRQQGQSSFPVFDGVELKGIISLDSIQRFLSIQGSLGY
jgi:Zn-dependent protease